jgi:threonine dehydratase
VPESEPALVSLDDVEAARATLQGKVTLTPTVRAPAFPGLPDTPIYLKLENLQLTGSFKVRGASNKMAHLSDAEARRGVIAASAGNHAQGVAYAARSRGIPATIVMAKSASPLKVSLTRALGARVILHGNNYDDAQQEAFRLAAEEGLTQIPPFDDRWVIAGQGTVGLEILEAVPDVRRVIVGIGGGGLLSGIATVLHAKNPKIEIIGVQPSGSSTAAASLAEGKVVLGPPPTTFADGLATRHIGELPFRIFQATGTRVVVVDDRAIARAVFLLLEQAKILTEGAGAIPLAALLVDPSLANDGPVVLVLSGGNLDPFMLDRILWIGLSAEGRLLRIRSGLSDQPGRLADFLAVAAQASANVRHILHDRESPGRVPGVVNVEVELEVRDPEHAVQVLAAYRAHGWAVERVLAVDK